VRHERHYTHEQATASTGWVAERLARMRDARERLNDEEARAALDEAGQTPRAATDSSTLSELAAKEVRKLRRAGLKLESQATDSQLHRLRIKAKRARYASELLAVTGSGKAARFVKAAKKLQDVLGENQDAVVAEERLRALVRVDDPSSTPLATGRLVERQQARRVRARRKLPSLWRNAEKRGAALCR